MQDAITPRDAELEVWYAVRKLDAAVRRLLVSMPTGPGRDDSWAAYAAERAALAPLVSELGAKLTSALPLRDEPAAKQWSQRCLLALLVLYDELELTELGSMASERAETPLQTQYCGIHDGGERFYSLLDDALATAATPPLAVQLLLFCLQAGLCGRIPTKNDPERQEYVRLLSLRVDEAAEHAHPPFPRETTRRRIAGVEFPFIYYVAAAVFVGCVWLTLNKLARYHECYEFPCSGWGAIGP